jgi:hypothetical protein
LVFFLEPHVHAGSSFSPWRFQSDTADPTGQPPPPQAPLAAAPGRTNPDPSPSLPFTPVSSRPSSSPALLSSGPAPVAPFVVAAPSSCPSPHHPARNGGRMRGSSPTASASIPSGKSGGGRRGPGARAAGVWDGRVGAAGAPAVQLQVRPQCVGVYPLRQPRLRTSGRSTPVGCLNLSCLCYCFVATTIV